MDRIFKKLISNSEIELVSYIKQYIESHPGTEILIGCDSQNKKADTIYAIVIGMYTPGKGAHVIYSRFIKKRDKDNIGRLLNEVWFSVEIAEKLKEELGITPTHIDIDLNPDPKYGSNQALASAVGIVTGMGYHVRHKGDSPMMTYCADSLVK